MVKKTRAALEMENRVLKRAKLASGVASVINQLIRYGFLAYMLLQLRLSIEALAGKETQANILVKVLSEMKGEFFAWLTAGGGIAYGVRQKYLRQKTTKRQAERIKKYEAEIDPSRTSSNLPKDGRTRKEDQV